jgi:hypothetical protein
MDAREWTTQIRVVGETLAKFGIELALEEVGLVTHGEPSEIAQAVRLAEKVLVKIN